MQPNNPCSLDSGHVGNGPGSKPAGTTRAAPVWRRPTALLVAGAIGIAAIGLAITENSRPALSQSLTAGGATIPASFADVVEKVTGAVVSIHVTNGVKLTSKSRGNRDLLPKIPKDNPLHDFFKRFGEGRRGLPVPQPSKAEGSGFIVSPDGYVVTNNHVIDEASEIKVSINENEKYTAELIGADPRTDLALLKIKSDKTFKHVSFASGRPRVGDWVIAVGNPFGLGGTVTAGIVSAHGRSIGAGPYDYLQLDAPVNRGNSGGPTFNLNGEVVGVNSAIYSPSGGNVGIAFAIPAALASRVVEQLKEHGSVSRGWLGVHIQSINEDLASGLGMKDAHGAIVSKVTKNGPASRSDISVGDAIVEVNGQRIEDSRDLARKIAALNPDSDARITVFRDGRQHDVTVKLGRFPGKKKLARLEQGGSVDEQDLGEFGLSLAPASAQGKPDAEGVVITAIEPGSEATRQGLRKGDVILKVTNKPVDVPGDVARNVREAKKQGRKWLVLLVKSGEQTRFVTLPLGKT